MPLSLFQRIITQQQSSSDWTISIFDRNGVIFARVPNPSNSRTVRFVHVAAGAVVAGRARQAAHRFAGGVALTTPPSAVRR